MIKNKGMTLIELSVVLMVISLIVGMSLGAIELRNHMILARTIREYKFFENIYTIFNDKYGYLPGDMPNASSFWSGANNGNGNGKITTSADDALLEATNEWSHLNASGIYTNVNSALPISSAGNNIPPASSYSISSGYYVYYLGASNIAGKNALVHAAKVNGDRATTAAIYPLDAYKIDLKIDDGMPNTGIYTAQDPLGGCINVNNYKTLGTSPACITYYRFTTIQ